MAGYTLRKSLIGAAASSTATRPVVIEVLEDRRLLSATAGAGAVTVVTPATATAMPLNKTYGTTLYLQAGQSFDGYLGVVTGATVNSRTNKISASINWGDGSVSTQGVITVGASGHIDVGGSHTYSAAGNYAIVITVSAAPIPVPGQATPDYVLLLGTINSKAVVASTASGVTLHESAGKSFTAAVGTFQFPAPGKRLSASINWGDGTASTGTVVSAGASGLDVLKFNITGTHTYAKAGTYAITVTVTQTNPPATYVLLVATIHSTAVVIKSSPSLDGTIKGTFLPLPTPSEDLAIMGSGNAGAMGAVSASGGFGLSEFTNALFGGITLTSTSGAGTVTLEFTGASGSSTGFPPPTLTYVVTGGTGQFAGANGSGTVGVTGGEDFTFTILSN